jgi:hypothetical protein
MVVNASKNPVLNPSDQNQTFMSAVMHFFVTYLGVDAK